MQGGVRSGIIVEVSSTARNTGDRPQIVGVFTWQVDWLVDFVRKFDLEKFHTTVHINMQMSILKNAPAAQIVHVSFELAAVVFDDVPLSHRVQLGTHSSAGGFDHEPAGQGCGGLGGGVKWWGRAAVGRG